MGRFLKKCYINYFSNYIFFMWAWALNIVQHTVLLKFSWVEQNCQRKPRSGMVQGWSQVSQTSFSQILSAPSPHKIFKKLCFSASVNFKAFLLDISRSNLIYVFLSFLQNLLTYPKLILDLKSVHPERRYWHFSETKYAETPFP